MTKTRGMSARLSRSRFPIESLENRTLLSSSSTFSADLSTDGGVPQVASSLPLLSSTDLPQPGSYQAFVSASGIDGESTDSVYLNQIVVSSFVFGAQNAAAATGPAIDTLQLTGPLANHSTGLLSDVATGTHLANLTLSVVSVSAHAQLIYSVQLSDVVVDSYEAADTTETWSVQYGQISVRLPHLQKRRLCQRAGRRRV